MIADHKYIKLFANVLPVKGANRSILCDTQRGEYRVIPNDLYDVLKHCDGKKIGDIITDFGENNRETIMEYVEVLFDKECIFFCDSQEEIDCFPQLDMTFQSPSVISNSILDIDSTSKHDVHALISELNDLGCENLEIRIYEPVAQNVFDSIYSALDNSLIEYCELIIPYNPEMKPIDYYDLMKMHRRIAKIVIHSCDSMVETKYSEECKEWEVFYTSQVINNSRCCGNVSEKYFNSYVPFVTEAMHYNSCLNKKVSIDKDGNIKNCPAMSRSFGILGKTKLSEVVAQSEFQHLWSINKDQIKTCKDCEFRFICQDCRAMVENREDPYSKPLKCKYNPYESVWEN